MADLKGNKLTLATNAPRTADTVDCRLATVRLEGGMNDDHEVCPSFLQAKTFSGGTDELYSVLNSSVHPDRG